MHLNKQRIKIILCLIIPFVGNWAHAQQAAKSRGFLQQEFIIKAFIEPQFKKSGNLQLNSNKTIDSLFGAIETAWKKVAPDTIKKYKVDLPLQDFYNLDVYCYFWTLISITQQIDLPFQYRQHLVKNYMLPAMIKDYETIKRNTNITTINLVHSGTLNNTLALGTGNGMDKETTLLCYKLYSDFSDLFKSLDKAPKDVREYAYYRLLDLNQFKYDLNAKYYFLNEDFDRSYNYVLTGLSTDNYSKRRVGEISRKLLNEFAKSGDQDKSFTLLNTLLINTTADNINRDTLLNWYLKVDSVKGRKMYANTLNKLSGSAFKKNGQTVKLPSDWRFLVNSVSADKLKKIKYFLFDVWHTACGPCILETPDLNAFYDKFKNRDDVLFIAVNTDQLNTKSDEKYVLKRAQELGIKFPVVYDNDITNINNQLSVHSYPSKFIISNTGEVITKTDNSDLTEAAFEVFIKELNN